MGGFIRTNANIKIGLLIGVDIELDGISPELFRQIRLDRKISALSPLPFSHIWQVYGSTSPSYCAS
jgi:hypothetical protein